MYDPKYFQKASARTTPSQLSPLPSVRKGPVAVINVKPDKKAEIRPAGNSYIERLALKKAEEESYYELWHKQFQEEVKKKVRAEPEKQPVCNLCVQQRFTYIIVCIYPFSVWN